MPDSVLDPAPRQPAADARIAHGGLLLLLMLVPAAHPPLNRWPIAGYAPVAAYLLLVGLFPSVRRSAAWLRTGRLSRVSLLGAAVLALSSTVALVVWAKSAHPDLHRFADRVPVGAGLTVLLAGLVFAVVNSAAEEIVWRGVLMDALDARFGILAAIVVQALGFGAGHYNGIPGGLVGVVLAAGYGTALGALRAAEKGLLLCLLVHICADATIFTFVAIQAARFP